MSWAYSAAQELRCICLVATGRLACMLSYFRFRAHFEIHLFSLSFFASVSFHGLERTPAAFCWFSRLSLLQSWRSQLLLMSLSMLQMLPLFYRLLCLFLSLFEHCFIPRSLACVCLCVCVTCSCICYAMMFSFARSLVTT